MHDEGKNNLDWKNSRQCVCRNVVLRCKTRGSVQKRETGKSLSSGQTIHSKNERPGRPDSAKYFAFSAKILTENAKSIKFVLFVELTLPFSPNYAQSLLKT